MESYYLFFPRKVNNTFLQRFIRKDCTKKEMVVTI